MYTAYFGFSSKPFKPKDPKDFYRNINFDAVCADLLDGIRERRGFILLTGEAGVGKTFTLRRCMAEAADIRFIQLINANLDFSDIVNYLCANLELSSAGLDARQRERLLLDHVAAESRHNRTVALLIDDAQHLAADTLLDLQGFVETPVIPGQRLQVVLAGLPEITDKLAQPRLRPLWDNIRVHCHLDPLSNLETGLFINQQLRMASDGDYPLLSPAAIERISTYCKGVPRAIAILCDVVLLLASLQSEQDITPELVDEAARSCFLGDPSKRLVGAGEDRGNGGNGGNQGDGGVGGIETPAAVAADTPDFDLDLSAFDFVFDFGEQGVTVKLPTKSAPGTEPMPEFAPVPPLPVDEPAASPAADQTVALPFARNRKSDGLASTVSLATPPKPAASAVPLSTALSEFIRLLEEVATGLGRRLEQDREAVGYFLNRYLRISQGGEPARLFDFERRINRLTEIQQPLFVGLSTALQSSPEQDGVLCVLLLNPTWWLYREVRLRLHGADLVFANDGQAPSLRLLDGRDAQPIYVHYRYSGAGSAQTALWLELDLCDHRGEWHAYNSSSEIRLDLPGGTSGGGWSGEAATRVEQHDRFWPEPLTAMIPTAGTWPVAESLSMRGVAGGAANETGNTVCTFPLELKLDQVRTDSLRSSVAHRLGRGTPLTRALLCAADPAQAPARIELVSRPFMIFGRHSSTAGTGFGDFTLGFVQKYTRISRLHCVVCALGDQLALMPASDAGSTYTGRNGQRLERGRWELLEANDTLEVCDLYRLRLTLAWDQKSEAAQPHWDLQPPREKFGHYLLELVDVLHQRDRQVETDELRNTLRERYVGLLRAQDQVARLNGVGNPGSLLYARFEREDAASRQIIHFYIPKWLSLGSAQQAGLRIQAEGVQPQHAELLFRDGMYWIQNLADPGAVQVGHHGLATNEVLALEAGDVLMIGAARFTFEAY